MAPSTNETTAATRPTLASLVFVSGATPPQSPPVASTAAATTADAAKDVKTRSRAPSSMPFSRQRSSKRARVDAGAGGNDAAGDSDGFLKRLNILRRSLPRRSGIGKKSSKKKAATSAVAGALTSIDENVASNEISNEDTAVLGAERDAESSPENTPAALQFDDDNEELVSQLRADVASAREALNDSLRSHVSVLIVKRREIEDAKTEMKDLRSRTASALCNLSEALKDREDMEQRLSAGGKLRKTLEEAVAAAESRCTKAEEGGSAVLAEARADAEALGKEREELAAVLAEVETRLAQTDRMLKEVEGEATKAKEEFDAERGMLKDTVRCQERTVESLKGRLTDIEEAKRRLEQKLTAAKSTCADLRQANDFLSAKMVELETSLAYKDTEVAELQAKLDDRSVADASEKQAKATVSTLELEVKQLTDRETTLRSDLVAAQTAAAEANESKSKAESELAAAVAREAEIREGAETAAASAKEKLVKAESEFALKSGDCAEVAANAARKGMDSVTLVSSLRAELEAAKTKMEKLAEAKGKAESEARKSTIKFKMIEKEAKKHNGLETQLEEVRKSLEEKTSLLESREKIIALLKRQMTLLKASENTKTNSAKDTTATGIGKSPIDAGEGKDKGGAESK